MSLRGKGMLVVFAEVKSRHESDFNEWYNREHIDERLGMPGFQRARRYVAAQGSPKYLAISECNRVGDLATPHYLAGLVNATPWTKKTTRRFTQFHRLTLSIKADRTHGLGGVLAAVRFVPDAGHRRNLIQWLASTAFPRAIKTAGMLGAAAGENEPHIANAPVRAQSVDKRKAVDREWVVFLEADNAEVVRRVARRIFKQSTLRQFGVRKAPVVGTYQFLFGNQN